MTAEKTLFGIPERMGEGGAFLSPGQERTAAGVSLSLGATLQGIAQKQAPFVTGIASIKAILTKDRIEGMRAFIIGDGSRWRYKAASTTTADDLAVLQPADTVGIAGRWVRETGEALFRLPITFATADAAILWTLPAGLILAPSDFWWDGIAVSFTGGTSSAIGLSSSTLSGHTTKGDLLGGSAGDVAAALTSTLGTTPGTVGTNWATLPNRRVFLKAADTLRFDRITSVFTAGTCNVAVRATILQEAA